MGRPLPTIKGYPLSEVISALQKEIRRGKEREAMYWAMELVPRYEKYLFRRLLTIVNEDIGIANPLALLLVPHFRQNYFEFRHLGKDGSACLILANCILLMCRSPKSRMADHFACCVIDERERGQKLPIPDYALDKHTMTGKRKGRGVKHWLTEGTILVPPADEQFDTYRAEAEGRWQRGVARLNIGGKATLEKGGNGVKLNDPEGTIPLFASQMDKGEDDLAE